MGDMRELGEEAKQEHQDVARELVKFVDYLYCVGPLTQAYVVPIAQKTERLKEVRWFGSSIEAGKYLRESMPEKALVLVKGSQNEIFLEEAIKQLLANKDEKRKLCRQEPGWLRRKKLLLARDVSAQTLQTDI